MKVWGMQLSSAGIFKAQYLDLVPPPPLTKKKQKQKQKLKKLGLIYFCKQYVFMDFPLFSSKYAIRENINK